MRGARELPVAEPTQAADFADGHSNVVKPNAARQPRTRAPNIECSGAGAAGAADTRETHALAAFVSCSASWSVRADVLSSVNAARAAPEVASIRPAYLRAPIASIKTELLSSSITPHCDVPQRRVHAQRGGKLEQQMITPSAPPHGPLSVTLLHATRHN